MRHALLIATLGLTLVACGSADPATGDDTDNQAAVDGSNQLDVCSFVPKDVADLLLGGAAHDPELDSDRDDAGTCLWQGAGPADSMTVLVTRSGTNAEVFDQLCNALTPPLPYIEEAGFGVAACGRFTAAGGDVFVLLDATTTVLGVQATVGTEAQALDVLRAIAGRLPPA